MSLGNNIFATLISKKSQLGLIFRTRESVKLFYKSNKLISEEKIETNEIRSNSFSFPQITSTLVSNRQQWRTKQNPIHIPRD